MARDERPEAFMDEGGLFLHSRQRARFLDQFIVQYQRRPHTYHYGLMMHMRQASG